MLAAQLVVVAGDRVVAVTPLWPNLVEIPKILGADVETVALGYGERGWQLDVEQLLAALTPDTKAADQLAEQSDRLGDERDDQRACSRIAAATASGSSPTKSTSVYMGTD